MSKAFNAYFNNFLIIFSFFLFTHSFLSPDNTPSWEPKHWGKVCPYPLCPSYRQVARLISIILIGEYPFAMRSTKHNTIGHN